MNASAAEEGDVTGAGDEPQDRQYIQLFHNSFFCGGRRHHTEQGQTSFGPSLPTIRASRGCSQAMRVLHMLPEIPRVLRKQLRLFSLLLMRINPGREPKENIVLHRDTYYPRIYSGKKEKEK